VVNKSDINDESIEDNSSSNISLVTSIERFFKSLNADEKVIELAEEIQKQTETGQTAIDSIPLKKEADDKFISSDGSKGYIVQTAGLSGFRRTFKHEMAIKKSFESSQSSPLAFNEVSMALAKVVEISHYRPEEELDLQWQACLSALHHSRFVLSGGPGTGKTTTIIRLMLLYLTLHPQKSIALCAPTGKAANRMMQSISQTLKSIELSTRLPEQLLEQLQQPAKTIHRFLAYNYQTNGLKYTANNPLPFDLVIVDESSMLDVHMTHALLCALKPEAHLVLLGDENQLPSVEAGNVFADLCSLLKPSKHSNLLHYYSGKEKNNTQLEIDNCVALKKNYRFQSGSIVAQLCENTLKQDWQAINKLSETNQFQWSNPNTIKEKIKHLSQWYNSIPAGETSILLSPVNYGFNSVQELNQLAKEILYNKQNYHEGMPVIVNKNDYTLEVFNGDIGTMTYWKDDINSAARNTWQLQFEQEGQTKSINLEAINSWSQANAISIHKSQGSEYDHVLIALPNETELEILSNALLYTALSRARKTITLWSEPSMLEKALFNKEKRQTFMNSL